ncbi:nuclease-related domain-containing protein [Arthrobacter sp. Y81]|uniref:nuclease-related domain-containing protein n=1 Tax=Arthrobacter sp. Y81 TaxID=2058897 RepID=UPI000CE324D2|nr:nuclease-related domain-containing protein [Arthrobacter sp. Y81]
MAAGDGAADQSRLAAERIARLKRQLDHAERASDTWGAGADGERRTANKLGELAPHGWFLLHDVHWPGRPLANLDHVLVGPGGVVVVDTKNWSGNVEVRDGVLRQNGYTRNPAVDGALGQAAAVAALLSAPHRRLVRSIICLTGQPDLGEVTDSGVEVLGVNRVVARIAALPAVLDQQAVVGVYSHLGQQLTQPQSSAAPNYRSMPIQGPARWPRQNPGQGAHQGTGYPSPLPSRYHGPVAGNAAGRLSPADTPRPPQYLKSLYGERQFRKSRAVGALWSLLILGIVALALSAPLWVR